MKTIIIALYPYNIQGLNSWHDHGFGMTYTAVKEAGCDIDSLDMKTISNDVQLREKLKGYDLIGFGLKSSYYAIGMKVIEIAKAQGSKVIVGGYHVTAAPEQLLENPDIDWVFHGESEITFPQFLKNPDRFPREIFGEKPQDLDVLPFIDRSIYKEPLENCNGWWHGGKYKQMTTVMAARGCPYNCAFCQPIERNHFGDKLRRKSVDRIIEELRQLKRLYNPDCMMIHDDTFLLQPKWIEEFIEKYPEIGLPFWASGRADGICEHPDLVRKLIKVGWELVSVGFESGSQRMLDLMKKGTTVEQNMEAAKIIKDAGAKIYANYILGFPWETKEDIQLTARMADKIQAEMPSWALFSPYPGSEMGEECIKSGLSLLDRNNYERSLGGKKVKNVDYGYVNAVLNGFRERMKITAITCTGDRPLAFSLCQKWIENQIVKPDQWIIVDDGKVPLSINNLPAYVNYIRRTPQENDPKITMVLNLREALNRVTGDHIIIIEDDEYYAPDYIKEMSKHLDNYEVVGICRARYYHLLSGGYYRHGNMTHASLAQTAFRKSQIPVLQSVFLEDINDMFTDMLFWEKIRSNGNRNSIHLFNDEGKKLLYLGIKGLPGRNGAGDGHETKMYQAFDKNRSILRQWVPDDYETYMNIIVRQKNDSRV